MVSLRDLTPADSAMLHQWRNLPEVAQYMYTDHQITAEEHRIWFDSIRDNTTRRYWIITSDGEDVGLANLYSIDRENQRCFWAFYIARPQQRGKGIGGFVEFQVLQYVFDTLKLNRLCCEVLASNQAVVEMHKGFGFAQEGYFRQHIWKAGAAQDVVSLAILRSDWEAKKPEIEARLQRIAARQERKAGAS